MNRKSIRISVISDVHLGHDNTPTNTITNNIINYFLSSPDVASSDIIFISGDLLDQLVSLSNGVSVDILTIMNIILRYCSDRGIKLRILKGTPSHDYDQNQHFVTLAKINNLPVDMKYINILDIEYISEWDINILYLPDEWRGQHLISEQEVKALLIERNLTHVDIAIMHGMFEQQVPKGVSIPTHNSVAYLSFVKGLIFIGHDHRYQNYGRITIPGSYDRIAHGEENPKGYVTAILNNDYSYTIKFHENKGAKKYLTIKLIKIPSENGLEVIDKVVALLDTSASIRLMVSDDYIAYQMVLKHCRAKYPQHTWLIERAESKKRKDKSIKDIVSTINAPNTINKLNIESELSARLFKLNPDKDAVTLAMNLFSTEVLREL